AKVTFEAAPAGSSSWSTLGVARSSPWSASVNTTKLGDGLYDLRAGGFDSLGALIRYAVRSDIRIDNERPSVASSVPADGSVGRAPGSIVLTATEKIASVTGVKLDSAGIAAPTISDTTVTFSTGPLAAGLHTLAGNLVDESGSKGHFVVSFTVPGGSASDPPPTAKNTSPSAATTLAASDGSATVTVPSGAYTAQETDGFEDWLVLRVDPSAPPT